MLLLVFVLLMAEFRQGNSEPDDDDDELDVVSNYMVRRESGTLWSTMCLRKCSYCTTDRANLSWQ